MLSLQNWGVLAVVLAERGAVGLQNWGVFTVVLSVLNWSAMRKPPLRDRPLGGASPIAFSGRSVALWAITYGGDFLPSLIIVPFDKTGVYNCCPY
jgi:hypothetical protein